MVVGISTTVTFVDVIVGAGVSTALTVVSVGGALVMSIGAGTLVMVRTCAASGPFVSGATGGFVSAGAALVGSGSDGSGSGVPPPLFFLAQLKAQVTTTASVAVIEMGTDSLFIFILAARLNPIWNNLNMVGNRGNTSKLFKTFPGGRGDFARRKI
jgi:hypothetical protein